MTSTRPDAPARRADQPLFAARKREPKYFALGTSTSSGAGAPPPTTTNPSTNTNENTKLAGPTGTNAHARAQSYADPATTLRGAWERAALEEGVASDN
ncbi:hypothetical protein V493_02393, partial [Pseudogymnoascus sp. VKM F-4281 (FW-2241)]